MWGRFRETTVWPLIMGDRTLGRYITLFSQYFIGYTLTLKRAFVAFGYNFIWGFLVGWLFAYLRNLFLGFYVYRMKRKEEILTFKDYLDYF